MLQNTPNCIVDKKSEEYAPIPLNIMCAVIHHLLFLYKKRIFLQLFFLQNFSKIFSKTHQIASFLKFSRGSMPPNPPNPPSKRVASPCAAWRFAPCKYPHFYKNKNLNPPPRNEILDAPLGTLDEITTRYVYSLNDLIDKHAPLLQQTITCAARSHACWYTILEHVHIQPFIGFSRFITNYLNSLYKYECCIRDCYVCNVING